MTQKIEEFSSRFGLIAAAIGMAIGAGNIWRFPRLTGQYGGSFLIPWFLFLFTWSIPLLIAEFSIGKKSRRGTIGSFIKAVGPGYAWMGFFVAFCATAILFYYSVVCGWSLKYLLLSLSAEIATINHQDYWQQYTTAIYQPLLYHAMSIFIGGWIIYRGIVGGVEKFSRYIVPLLFILLIISALKALTLVGAGIGLNYFFSFDRGQLSNHRLWLDALSQSAWSTGAGWGLLLTYATYARKEDKIIGNSFFTGLGNNIASIFAGLAIIPTVFALSSSIEAAHASLDSGNQGLAFITLPQLFFRMTGGRFFSIIFFAALFFAALSSLISMIELAVRILMDFGLKRKRAVMIIVSLAFLLGAPSAVSLDFFNNQDWVWGLGLLLSGAFFCFSVIKIGIDRFIDEWLVPVKYRSFFVITGKLLFYVVIPFEFIAMLSWWLLQSIQWNPQTWWKPFSTYSLATVLWQWLLIILIGLIFNKKFNRWIHTVNHRIPDQS